MAKVGRRIGQSACFYSFRRLEHGQETLEILHLHSYSDPQSIL